MSTTDRNVGIDALRGIAVLMVLFFHSHIPSFGVDFYDGFIGFFNDYGTLGVDLFFVLSGFCIHRAYAKKDAIFDPKVYALRRWWRIYPPYFFALSLAVCLNLGTNYFKWRTGGDISWANFGPIPVFSHLFMVHNLSQETMLTISGPFWTIAAEVQYYLLYCLLRPLFKDRLGWAMLFLGSIILYFVAWHFYYQPIRIQPLNPFCYWVEWVLGAFLADLWRNHPSAFKPISCSVGLAVFFGAMFLYSSKLLADPLWTRLIAASGLVALTAFTLGTETLWRSRPLRWLSWVGLFSYSIYLTHFMLIDRFRVFVIVNLPQGMWRVAASMAALAAALTVAYIFYRCFERPFHDKAASYAQ